MGWVQLYIILAIVIAGIAVGIYFLRKKFLQKIDAQKSLVDQHKVPASLLILEKKMDRVTNANMPKAVVDQIPKVYKLKKVPIVRAKIGAQVMDFLCDEDVFEKLPLRKTVRVELAGIFIASVKPTKR